MAFQSISLIGLKPFQKGANRLPRVIKNEANLLHNQQSIDKKNPLEAYLWNKDFGNAIRHYVAFLFFNKANKWLLIDLKVISLKRD